MRSRCARVSGPGWPRKLSESTSSMFFWEFHAPFGLPTPKSRRDTFILRWRWDSLTKPYCILQCILKEKHSKVTPLPRNGPNFTSFRSWLVKRSIGFSEKHTRSRFRWFAGPSGTSNIAAPAPHLFFWLDSPHLYRDWWGYPFIIVEKRNHAFMFSRRLDPPLSPRSMSQITLSKHTHAPQL